MIIDAHSVPAGTVIETDVVVIGGGAAGISLALEFIGAKFRAVLLESGSREIDADTQDLYAGTEIGRSYQDLTTSRLRFLGGTTNHWGGWCTPLDPIDFETREWMPHSGWPFDRAHLDPWYRRAHSVVELGTYEYDPQRWGIPAKRILPPFKGPHFVLNLLQQSPPTRFGTRYEPELNRADRVTVYLNANAMTLTSNEAGGEVRAVEVGTLGGNRFTVKARAYVLATGGIENARILLLSGPPGGNGGLGNANDLVGRFFTVHLVYPGGVIVPSDRYADLDFLSILDYRGRQHGGVTGWCIPFIGLSPESRHRHALPGVSIFPRYQFAPVHGAIEALKRLIGKGEKGGKASDGWSDMQSVLRQIDGVAEFGLRKAMFDQGIPVDAVNLGVAGEQLPNPDSRIRLGDERDALGLRRTAVEWRLTAEDKRKAFEIQRLLGAEVGRAGMGRLRPSIVDADENAWPPDFYGDAHHMGTTRMHRDPARGVVDQDCRVHGVGNLYVAGSSVFPNSGSVNPTLTIVALALRLADHIKERFA